eukprot:2135913-Rhodomonas_salina.2
MFGVLLEVRGAPPARCVVACAVLTSESTCFFHIVYLVRPAGVSCTSLPSCSPSSHHTLSEPLDLLAHLFAALWQLGQHVPWPANATVKISPPEPAQVASVNSQGIVTIPQFLPLEPKPDYTVP